MTETCTTPAFQRLEAAELARRLFRLEGEFRRLPGERDLNYLADTSAGRYVFKIAHRDEKPGMFDCQRKVLARLRDAKVFAHAPLWLESAGGNAVEKVTAADGSAHYARALEYVDGRPMSRVNPHTPELLESWGEKVALFDRALEGFSHDALARPLLWEMERGAEVVQKFSPLLESDARRELVRHFSAVYQSEIPPRIPQLRRGVIHNDANADNVLVAGPGDDPWAQRATQIIDFGDMRESWLAADAAIAAAYAMLGKARPLDAAESVARGYHRAHPLREAEIEALFPLMCMRLCMSVCICAHQRAQSPQNDYLRVSEDAAWAALEILRDIPPRFARYAFRAACGLEANPNSPAVVEWLRANAPFAPVVGADLANDKLLVFDASVASPLLGAPGAGDPAEAARMLFRAVEDQGCAAAVARYDEHRLIYTHKTFDDITGHRRTLHLGMDIFMPAGAPVHAPLGGKVYTAGNRDNPLDYGGLLIIEHRVKDRDGNALVFHTLYGHLQPASVARWKPGDEIAAGAEVARFGDVGENGGWPPHLHFEIITDMLGNRDTFVGVGTQRHRAVWLSLCPDPNLMLGIPPEQLRPPPRGDARQLLDARRRALGPSLRLSHREPIHLARGAMQYLFDMHGRRYLDAVNNIAHVGHCHPRVVAAERMQAGLLNTNTRYLYDALAAYTERLLEKFPEELSVCYLVCSGSEANDLALRLARCHTGRRDVVALRHAYHGNLSSTIEISSYKHDGAGGAGRPAHVHIAEIPDAYRGAHRGADAGEQYARDVRRALADAEARGGAAAFIAESLPGCGGQVAPPSGYLRAAYAHARAAGAVCIADEVQTGFGRVGDHFWGFEAQDATPDIATLGKPIGNGHPMAAVVTTREIAASFDNGMEYFNSFGGNPVSCAVGHAVLDVLDGEQLPENARVVGGALRGMLRELQARFALIGDVRGMGLFIGAELVNARDTLAPAAAQAAYIAERMKQEGVLVGVDGALRNVLKIKPPMCFSAEDAETLARVLEGVLREDFAQPDECAAAPR